MSRTKQVEILVAFAKSHGVNAGQIDYSYGSGLVVCGRQCDGVRDGKRAILAFAETEGCAT